MARQILVMLMWLSKNALFIAVRVVVKSHSRPCVNKMNISNCAVYSNVNPASFINNIMWMVCLLKLILIHKCNFQRDDRIRPLLRVQCYSDNLIAMPMISYLDVICMKICSLWRSLYLLARLSQLYAKRRYLILHTRVKRQSID